MNQRMMIAITVALTAAVLVLIGSLTSRLNQANATTPTVTVEPTAEAEVIPPTTVAIDPTTQALIDQREATYRQALSEANARLEEANRRIAEANQRIAEAAKNAQASQSSANTTAPAAARPVANPKPAIVQPTIAPAIPVAPAAPTYAISPEQAAMIALSVAPGAKLIRAPEVVDFQGTPAYEVALDAGMVYIDAQTGSVLYNAAAPQPAHSGEHEDGEHEGGGDD